MGDGGVACVVSSSSSHVMARRFMYYNGTLRSSLQFPDRSPEKSSLDKKMEMKGKEEIEDGEVVPEYRRSYGDSRRKRLLREDNEQLTRRQSYEHKDLSSKSRRVSEDNHSSGFSSSRNYRESQESRYGRHHDYRDHRAQSPVSLERRYERNSIRSSPGNSERRDERSNRSPNNSDRRHDHRIRSPTKTDKRYDRRDRSPLHSSRRHDHRMRSPTNQDKRSDHRIRSSSNSKKRRDHRIRSPSNLDKQHEQRERTPPSNTERSPRCPDSREKESKEKTAHKNSRGDDELEKDSQKSSGGRSAERSLTDDKRAKEKKSSSPNCKEKSSSPTDDLVGDTPADELESMEEDMDICDSPPYIAPEASNNLNASVGNWFYIDSYGVDKGPSQLSDIKKMVDDGLMVSDHMIKHAQSDRWVTVENAVSPLVTMSSLSVVSDTVTQLASPPEASGNVLTEAGDSTPAPISAKMKSGACFEIDLNAPADYCVDERVEELMKGFSLVPGREVEVIAEALLSMPDSADMEVLIGPWDFSLDWSRHITDEGYYRGNEMKSSSSLHGASSVAPPERYLFTGRWSCQGGDWKRNDEGSHDRQFKRKIVSNDGYPLCEMPRSSHPDPRWHRPEIYNSHFRRLEIPPWAYNWHEDCSDNEQQQTDDHVEASTAQETSGSVGQDSTNNFHASSSQPNLGVITNSENKSVAATRPSQNRLLSPKVPPKGLIQPVVRGNASMFKNHASVIKELHKKLQQRVDGQSSHSSKSHAPAACDSIENGSETNVQETDMTSVTKSGAVDYMVMDRVLTVDELNLHQGNWYYLDGAGRERGPFDFSWLQALVAKGDLPANSSAYRKLDNIWVPIMMNSSQLPRLSHGLQYSGCVSAAMGTMQVMNCLQHIQRANHSLVPILPEAPPDMSNNVGAFHFKHPHFVGYTRGRLHELVMSSFRKRDFVTAINEVLDPWLNMKQPKKADLPLEAYVARKASQGEQGGNDDQEESLGSMSFDALCGSTFKNESNMHPAAQSQSWGLLEDQFLARVFHYLRADMKSLACSAATCKHWNNAAKIYKNLSKHVDVSQLASNCTDSIFLNIMRGYCKEKILCIDLTGCSHVSAGALEAVLRMFPSIRSVFTRGCGQFAGLAQKFPTVKWRNNSLCATDGLRGKSLRQGVEKSTSWAFKGLDGYLDDNNKTSRRPGDYYSSFDNFSNRSRYFGSRKYKSGLSQTGRMKGVFASKALPLSVRRYMQKQNAIDLGLKEIMEDNVFEFFMPKVAEIQNRMSNGYYLEHGLKSVTDDISRMCRDALKVSSRTDGDIMNIIKQFMKLVMSLGQNSKTPDRSDEMEKASKEGSVSGRKKLLKKIDEKKGLRRSGSSYGNGVADLGDAASERERRRLARLSRRSMDSESETSNDSELSRESKEDQDDEYDSRADPDFDSDDEHGKQASVLDSMVEDREWGARMTKASLVPPVTRKYEPIDRYVIVADKEDVQRKMRVALPDDYVEKLAAQKESGDDSSQLPEVKDYKPRKKLGSEVIEQEVYGIDPYTHNLLLDSVPDDLDWPLSEKHDFIEEVLLPSLNKQVRHFTGTGNAPMEYPLKPVIEEILKDAEKIDHTRYAEFARVLLASMKSRPDDQYVAYRKGLGVVCNSTGGFGVDDFVVEFLGEVYPTWKWYEKQDGIRSLQKNKTDPAPEFYNIYLERPKGDRDGYDLVVVDAMHKANYASRICHSCLPNCEAKVTAVDGHYQIGIYTVKPIGNGEEVTFDYNSVTESKEEYEKSVCLCGSKFCRGSYLNLTGEGAFQMIMKEFHGVLDRHKLMLEACESSSVSEEDYDVLAKAGFGTCLLCALPNWLIAYSARLVRYINFERTKLPEEIFKYNLEEKKKFFTDIDIEGEKEEAQVHADGVYNQRLQNLAVTLDKVRYVLRSVFEDSKKAPPPLQRPKPEVLVCLLWRGEGSLVEELLQCMASNVDEDLLKDLKTKIHARDPCASDDIRRALRECLLWLRDELRSLPSSSKCRNDAAADLIHMYAYTNCFFTVREYKSFTSEPVYISPLDLGPKYADTMGPGFQEYRKTYGENYCLGQLIYWYNQSYSNPDSNLVRARRGCLSFPQLSSFYGRTKKLSRKSVYSQKTLRLMTSVMEKQPQRPWPKDQIWVFKSKQRVFGSPMMDAVMNGSSVDREMMQWLKTRPTMYQ